MINTSEIKPHMPVVCSEGGQFATVDHMQGRHIKLTRDKSGAHHFIPVDWVTSVDAQVHVDRPGDQAMREWATSPDDGDQTELERRAEASASTDDPLNVERVRSGQTDKRPELDPARAERLQKH